MHNLLILVMKKLDFTGTRLRIQQHSLGANGPILAHNSLHTSLYLHENQKLIWTNIIMSKNNQFCSNVEKYKVNLS